VEIVNRAMDNKRKICAIGTTSMRSMESSVSAHDQLKPSSGWTNLFIHPPYEFKIANCLLTNFHLPKSSLIIMVSAFAGHELTMRAYEEAIKNDYRFYSYGDAMLII
jgi:S-adenosylmethionine:tRNA ribosyltransferase-isomerase